MIRPWKRVAWWSLTVWGTGLALVGLVADVGWYVPIGLIAIAVAVGLAVGELIRLRR